MDDNEINYISDAETEPADLYGSNDDLVGYLHLINRLEVAGRLTQSRTSSIGEDPGL